MASRASASQRRSPRRADTEDRRRVHGDRTRREILETAVPLAARRGLEGLSIGLLAAELGMSKAGIFGHFGSKEALQLAVVDEAHAMLVRAISKRAEAGDPMERLRGMLEGYLEHVRREAESGGHFFITVMGEFAQRRGKVHDRLVAIQREWHELVAAALRDAVAGGRLAAETDCEQLGFELLSLAQGACHAHALFGDPAYLLRARAALEKLLAAAQR